MKDTVLRWISKCGDIDTLPVDELLAAGYPIAAVVVAATYAGKRATPPQPHIARWVRARDACFGPNRNRLVADIPAGIVISALIDPATLNEETAADDPIRAGYACPDRVVRAAPPGGGVREYDSNYVRECDSAVLRLRAAADPEANAAVESAAGGRTFAFPDGGTAIQTAVWCVRARYDFTLMMLSAVRAVAAGQLDPELALAIVLRRYCVLTSSTDIEDGTIATVVGDALEAKQLACATRLVLPPIII